MSVKGHGGVVTNYNGSDFSAESWAQFARGYGKKVFTEALRNHPIAKDLGLSDGKTGKMLSEKIVENMDIGSVSLPSATEQNMIQAGRKLRNIIEKNFLEGQVSHDYGFDNLPGPKPTVHVNYNSQSVYIDYNPEYLRRPSLMNAYKTNGYNRIGRKRIGEGLKDIYGYMAKGIQGNKPRRVIGFWKTSKDIFGGQTTISLNSESSFSTRKPGLVVGNVHKREGNDFVVESIEQFFKDAWVKKNIPHVRVIIPSAWSKSGLISFDKYNVGKLTSMLEVDTVATE